VSQYVWRLSRSMVSKVGLWCEASARIPNNVCFNVVHEQLSRLNYFLQGFGLKDSMIKV
jgi:hypothetical protein